jgi:tetratricopeptide (TPR) repeat protein
MSSERLEQLTAMLQRQPRDAFLLYAMGMEYRKLHDLPRSLAQFAKVIEVDPNYAYAYYQQGQVHELSGDKEAARRAYRAGIEASARAGDAHATEELQSALALLGD